MAKAKAHSKGSKLIPRIGISAIGIALILMAVSNVCLYFLGDSTHTVVTTRRVGGAHTNSAPNQRYEWSVDYTFVDRQGETHDGHSTRRGGDMSVDYIDTVYYFTFAPYINSLEDVATPSIGQPIMVALGIFLLYVMNRKAKGTDVKHKSYVASNGEKIVPELQDYDDSVEDVYHDK